MYPKVIKRGIDVLLSFLALVVLSPVFLLLILLVKLTSRGPVLFRQKRVGRGKAYFTILKFRTMYADTPSDVPTHLLKDPSARITPMGRFLRFTSLDELPQMLNILCGQMSIIGPRPALWNQDDLVTARDAYGANDVTPGLTGLAQVSGRDELPIAQKAELDGYYAQHIGFLLDCRIFLHTILNVFRGSGVVEGKQEGTASGQTDPLANGTVSSLKGQGNGRSNPSEMDM